MGSFLPISEGKGRGCSQKAVLSGAFLSGDHGTVDAGEVLLLSLADEREEGNVHLIKHRARA